MKGQYIDIFKDYLSSGESYAKVGKRYDISGSRIDQIIKKVCRDLKRLSYNGAIQLPIDSDLYYSTSELKNNHENCDRTISVIVPSGRSTKCVDSSCEKDSPYKRATVGQLVIPMANTIQSINSTTFVSYHQRLHFFD